MYHNTSSAELASMSENSGAIRDKCGRRQGDASRRVVHQVAANAEILSFGGKKVVGKPSDNG